MVLCHNLLFYGIYTALVSLVFGSDIPSAFCFYTDIGRGLGIL